VSDDKIVRPAHYAGFTIDPITFINANGLSFNAGNVVKYVTRAPRKGGVADLLKARRYLDIEIERLAREQRVAAGEAPGDVWKDML
jgi:hypothetical protein